MPSLPAASPARRVLKEVFGYADFRPGQEVWWRKIETGALQTTSRVPLVGKRISLGGEQRTITSGFFSLFFIYFLFLPFGHAHLCGR